MPHNVAAAQAIFAFQRAYLLLKTTRDSLEAARCSYLLACEALHIQPREIT